MKSKSQSDAKASTAITRRAPGERKGLRKSAAGKGGSLALRKTGANQKTSQSLDRLAIALEKARAATGTRSEEVADWIIAQLAGAQLSAASKGASDDRVSSAIRLMAEMAPQNMTESMLCAQTISASDAALEFLGRAGRAGQSTEMIDANVNRAVNLMRVFNEQVALMQKLKGKMAPQQKVIVEHVHVHVNEGGKAIVGVQPQLAGVVHEDDAPSCPDCGAIMVRNGACFRCMNCGSTSGCS